MYLLFLKADQHYAHQAGYYLLQGRWHKIKPGKSAPKGAPVAAHPHAAGQFQPAKHFTDEQWQSMKLPEGHTSAKHYNAKLDALKEHSEAGHVTGILGTQFGTDTYAKKAVKVANELLGKHGSAHQVTPGQKAGTHAAVQKMPEATEAQPEPVAAPQAAAAEPVAAIDAQALKLLNNKMSWAPASKPEQAQSIAAEFVAEHGNSDEAKAAATASLNKYGFTSPYSTTPADQPAAGVSAETVTAPPKQGDASTPHASGLEMPQFDGGTKGQSVIDHYQKIGSQIMQLAAAGDADGLAQLKAKGLAPNKSGKVGQSWQGKTKNSKALLGLYQQALDTIGVDKGGPAQAPHTTEQGPQEGDTKQGADGHTLVLKDGHWVLQDPEPATDSNGGISAAAKQALDLLPWDKIYNSLPDSNKNAKSHKKKVATVKGYAYAGKLEDLQAMPFSVNTYGKQQAKLAAAAIEALQAHPVSAEPASATEQVSDPQTATIAKLIADAGSFSGADEVASTYINQFDSPQAKGIAYDQVIDAMDAVGYSSLVQKYTKAKLELAASQVPGIDDAPSLSAEPPAPPAIGDFNTKLAAKTLHNMAKKGDAQGVMTAAKKFTLNFVGDHEKLKKFMADADNAAFVSYVGDLSKWASSQLQQAASEPQKPTPPQVNGHDYAYYVEDIGNSIKHGWGSVLQGDIATLEGSQDEDGKKVLQYAKEALAYVQAMQALQAKQEAPATASPEAVAGTKPLKPFIATYPHTVNLIAEYIDAGDLEELQDKLIDIDPSVSAQAKQAYQYALDGIAYVKAQQGLAKEPEAAAPEQVQSVDPQKPTEPEIKGYTFTIKGITHAIEHGNIEALKANIAALKVSKPSEPGKLEQALDYAMKGLAYLEAVQAQQGAAKETEPQSSLTLEDAMDSILAQAGGYTGKMASLSPIMHTTLEMAAKLAKNYDDPKLAYQQLDEAIKDSSMKLGLKSELSYMLHSMTKLDSADLQTLLDHEPVTVPTEHVTFKFQHGAWHKKLADGQPDEFMTASSAVTAALSASAGLPVNHGKMSETVKDMAIALTTELFGNEGMPKLLDGIYPPAGNYGDPKEGDIKTVNGVQYVLHNGKWHKLAADESSQDQAAASDAHPLDQVPKPDLSAYSATHQGLIKDALEQLVNDAKAQGAAAFKGVIKNMAATGKTILKLKKPSGGTLTVHAHKDSPKTGALAAYVTALKEAAGGKAAKPAKKKAAPTPESVMAQKFGDSAPSSWGSGEPGDGNPITVHVSVLASGKPIPMDGWEQTGGQGGSNPGGKFKDPEGVEWYCKFPPNEEHAKGEVLAAKLYELAGVDGQKCKLITKDGKLGIASQWHEVHQATAAELAKAPGTLDGFAVDAWLANWDVVGLGLDNLQLDDDGKAVRVDAGGSLMFRAQGEKKPFGPEVTELQTLLDPAKNSKSHSVFKNITEADIAASVTKVLRIPDEDIEHLVSAFGPGSPEDKMQLVKTLIARKQYLAEKYPDALKSLEKPPVYRIPTPPDFKNWHGDGKGLSSHDAYNSQNKRLAELLYEKGQQGDVAAVENLQYQPINHEGNGVGQPVSIASHPSKHIPAYLKDVLQAMVTPYKSSKGASKGTLMGMNDAFKALRETFKGFAVLKQAAQKLGRYAVLGKVVGGNPLANWKPQTISKYQGSLDEHALYKQSRESFDNLSAVEKQAIKDYTGNSYGSMNTAIITGQGHDKAFYAINGIEKASIPLQPGTILSRKFSFSKNEDGTNSDANHQAAMKALIEAGEGTILQEFGIISTSTNPGVWSNDVHLKITVGEGVKGLFVANDPKGSGSAISLHPSESEIVLPYGTKFMVTKIHPKGHSFKDEAGHWGSSGGAVVEVTILSNI